MLAISEDRRGALRRSVSREARLTDLAIYLDPKNDVGAAFGVAGLPTSILIDERGRIVAELEGAAEWDSPKMLATLDRYLRPAEGGVIKTSLKH